MRKFYHYSPGDSSSESGFEESLCTGSPSRTEAVYDRYHSCYRPLHDFQKWYCHPGQRFPDSPLDSDTRARGSLLWFEKDQERRDFTDLADLSVCLCRNRHIWILISYFLYDCQYGNKRIGMKTIEIVSVL